MTTKPTIEQARQWLSTLNDPNATEREVLDAGKAMLTSWAEEVDRIKAEVAASGLPLPEAIGLMQARTGWGEESARQAVLKLPAYADG